MLRCDESACSSPDDGLAMCVMCKRNVGVDKGCARQVVSDYAPYMEDHNLVCDGFVMNKIETKKR